MRFGLRVRLSVMMFLQYFVWGIWLPMLGQHLTKSGFTLSKDQIGWIFTVYGFGAIIGPFLLGQLADRYFATERVMAVAHLLGGLLLIATASATSFWTIFGMLFVYCNLYMPTMGLSNSITFRTLGEANQSTSRASGSGARSAGSSRAFSSPPTSNTGRWASTDPSSRSSAWRRPSPASWPGGRRTSSRCWSPCSGSPGSASRSSATACGSPARSRPCMRCIA
jgi:MFS family permease